MDRQEILEAVCFLSALLFGLAGFGALFVALLNAAGYVK